MASEFDQEWCGVVKEKLIDTGACYAGCILDSTRCNPFASACSEGDPKALSVQSEPYIGEYTDPDGNKNSVEVPDEREIVGEIIRRDGGQRGTYPDGVWIAQEKYHLCMTREYELEGEPYTFIFGQRAGFPKMKFGLCLCGESVVIGFFDEKSQPGGKATEGMLNLVGALIAEIS